MKQRILIYGDSNVWGDNLIGARIHYADRWANRLAKSLRSKATIISDGVCGRVAGAYRADAPHRNGQATFTDAIAKAGRIDMVIIALGTNDTQQHFDRTVDNIINDLLWYQQASGGKPVIYLLPPAFLPDQPLTPKFTTRSLQKQRELNDRCSELGQYILLPRIELSDGIHFSAKGHRDVHQHVCQHIMAPIYKWPLGKAAR